MGRNLVYGALRDVMEGGLQGDRLHIRGFGSAGGQYP